MHHARARCLSLLPRSFSPFSALCARTPFGSRVANRRCMRVTLRAHCGRTAWPRGEFEHGIASSTDALACIKSSALSSQQFSSKRVAKFRLFDLSLRAQLGTIALTIL